MCKRKLENNIQKNALLKEIMDGEHQQFIFNAEKDKVECRCGHAAVWFQTGFICGTITAYPCIYNRKKCLLSNEQKQADKHQIFKP